MSEDLQANPSSGRSDQCRPTGTRRALAVRMTQIVMPNDSKGHGTVSGHRVMHLIDICGAVAALRHAGCPVITASFDDVAFIASVPVGGIS